MNNTIIIIECNGTDANTDLKEAYIELQELKSIGASECSKLKFDGREMPAVAGLWGKGDFHTFMAANYNILNGEKDQFVAKLPRNCKRGSIIYALNHANLYLKGRFSEADCFSQDEIKKIASLYPTEDDQAKVEEIGHEAKFR